MADHPEIPENNSDEPKAEVVMPDLLVDEEKKDVIKTFVPVVLIELFFTAIMVVVYISLGKCTSKVIYGALLGAGAEIVNFLAMIHSLLKAEKAESPAKGQIQVRGRYMSRMVVLLIVLVLALKTGYFEPIATLLPLCFMRIALFSSQLLYKFVTDKRKKGDNS